MTILLSCALYGTCFAQEKFRDISKIHVSESNANNEKRVQKDNPKIREQVEKFYKDIEIQRNTHTNDTVLTLKKGDIIFRDFVLYRDVVRRYSWLEGLGEPITQEEANHLPYYFRLSLKNNSGHYQLVEAMNGKRLTSLHPLNTYILDKTYDDNTSNQEWREKLLLVGQWEFFSDPSGENVLEERAYEAKEKDAKLVYLMQPIRNDDNHVTITYTDSYGYPADMNEDERFTYGSVVYITYDRNGCDSIIDYLDGEGYRKPNTNGVDQTRCIYDDKHRIILLTSNNCVGDYAIDNWGNCGMRYIYDDDKNTYSIICVDNNLKPMRMPSLRAQDDETFIRCDIKKDKWGRKEEAIILTAEGEKDVTQSGIHRIKYVYSPDGKLLEKKFYDINGSLIN